MKVAPLQFIFGLVLLFFVAELSISCLNLESKFELFESENNTDEPELFDDDSSDDKLSSECFLTLLNTDFIQFNKRKFPLIKKLGIILSSPNEPLFSPPDFI